MSLSDYVLVLAHQLLSIRRVSSTPTLLCSYCSPNHLQLIIILITNHASSLSPSVICHPLQCLPSTHLPSLSLSLSPSLPPSLSLTQHKPPSSNHHHFRPASSSKTPPLPTQPTHQKKGTAGSRRPGRAGSSRAAGSRAASGCPRRPPRRCRSVLSCRLRPCRG
jgi:hypothetical protein